MTASTRSRKPAADALKTAWKQTNDAGPHKATLPSGTTVTFQIPNSTALIRADMLPDRLAEIAIMAAAYPDGAEGYLADLGIAAMRDPNEASRLKRALREGIELRDWLIAEMLLEPKLSPAEVASGDYPQPDLDMLIEFAERRRDTDAAGVKLPITVLEELATFRAGENGSADGEAGAAGEGVAAVDPDGDHGP
jgi:hypothetical protein